LVVRKEKKEESLKKRRQLTVSDSADAPDVAAASEQSQQTSSMATMGSNSDGTQRTFVLSDTPDMMRMMKSTDVNAQVAALRGFRRLLSVERDPPVQHCIDCGAVPMFVEFLQRNDSVQLQFEAAWALTNIASTDRTRVLVESMAIPSLALLLNSANPEVREQSAWCLGNVAGDGSELRDVVLSSNAMPYLLANVQQPANLPLLRNCTWALSNFCRGKPAPSLAIVQTALPVLAHLLTQCSDEDTVVDATWALSYISDGNNDRIQAVVDAGVVPTLVAMLHSGKVNAITPALRTLGNIVSGNDEHTQAVVRANVLSAMVPLLSHSKKNIRKEACWMLSNVAAGTIDQIQGVIAQPGLVAKVLEQLGASSEWDVRKEAAWVVSNIATAAQVTPVMVASIVGAGAIQPLCDLLVASDVRIVMIALDALENILRVMATDGASFGFNVVEMMDEAGGINKLEDLQEHDDTKIYERAVKLIETYFTEEGASEGTSENLAPQLAGNGNTFAFGLSSQNTVSGKAFDFASISQGPVPTFQSGFQF
jgi:HEAT repeat protein